MKTERITSVESPLLRGFMSIFESSFPESERRRKESLLDIVENEPRFHCEVSNITDESDSDALDDKHVEGILCYWAFSDFSYIEYLAIADSLRGKGGGSQIIKSFLSKSTVPVILEVEPPTDDITKRRIAFYERLGFRLLSAKYIQPSYGVVPGPELKLMLFDNGKSLNDNSPLMPYQCNTDRQNYYIYTLKREVYGEIEFCQ